MALSVKMAALTCFGFIFGMSWLVSLVARPMVEAPTPLIVRGLSAPAGGNTVLVSRDAAPSGAPKRPLAVAGRFERPSPVEVAAEAPRSGTEEVLAIADELLRHAKRAIPLPPLHVPDAPVLAVGDESAPAGVTVAEAGRPAEAESGPSELGTAIAASASRLLAAQMPDLVPDEAAGERDGEASVSGPVPAAPVAKRYEVRRGDTLVKIMRREWSSDDAKLLEVLLAANPRIAKRPDRIYVGEVLRIPELGADRRAPAVAPARLVRRANAVRLASRGEPRWYTIRKRDSLAKIARRMLNDERRWPEIARLNRMRDAHRIIPGRRIMLPPVDQDA